MTMPLSFLHLSLGPVKCSELVQGTPQVFFILSWNGEYSKLAI